MNGETRKEAVIAYLALGSNLGERMEQMKGARRMLHEGSPGVRVIAASPLYETEPVGGPEGQPPYLNAVLQIETTRSGRDLLHLCLEVESRFGRRRTESWGPRTLDIDLLFYGAEAHDEPGFVVPHPRLHQRRFVLVPLADLSPGLLHPVLGRSVSELMAGLCDMHDVRLYAREW